MLKLKKLQILGFKSFCDRTELKFPGEGIAAVVGPNGCGKSNIADSIAWVLGEQSAKSLRGVRMEDVIFAGTRDRKATGMAEVSLTLVDPEVYEGQASGEPEVDIQGQMPEAEDDWDEASLRAKAAQATEAAVSEAQPGPLDRLDLEGGNESPEDGNDGAPQSTEPPAESMQTTPVVLKIRRRKFKPMRLAKGEIVVTRRLFRTGESEYLLNGKVCRLRDIQDIFMGTGLGPESYAIIEQGRIGQILSSKPHDRRAIIEEAAGITKFKARKRLAEARLESSRQNLARINDIFEEVTRQMNSLKRQASKAERYARLRDEMRDKLKVVLASKFAQIGREEAAIQESVENLAEEIRGRAEAVASREAEHAQRTQRGYAIETEVAANRQALQALAVETERAMGRQAANQERCDELEARSAAAVSELEDAKKRSESLDIEAESNGRFAESSAGELAQAQHDWQTRQQHAHEAAVSLADVERSQETRRQTLMEVMASAAELRNQATQAEEHMGALDRETQRLERELAAAQADAETSGGNRARMAADFESTGAKVVELNQRIAEARSQIETRRREEEETKRHLDGLRSAFATALGKKASLEAVISEHGYSTESVKRLFQSSAVGHSFTPAGVLADFIEVDTRYEGVLEEFLRDELNYVVVKSWDCAHEGVRLLETDVEGRATFLVHPENAHPENAHPENAHPENAHPVNGHPENGHPGALRGENGHLQNAESVQPLDVQSFVAGTAAAPVLPKEVANDSRLVSLKHCIRVLNGFGQSLEVVLPKLRDGYIVPDSALARTLALENPHAYFLSSNGECFHNLTVTGGKQRNEGPLSLKRELREVCKLASDLEAGIQNEQSKVQTLGQEMAELSRLLITLEDERREAEKQAMSLDHALKQLESELARTRQRMETFRRELEHAGAEKEQAKAAVSERRAGAEELEQKRQNLENEIRSTRAQLDSLRTLRDNSAQTVAEAAARLAGLEERCRLAKSALQRSEALAREARERVQTLETQIQAAAAEKQQRAAENLQISSRLEALAAEKAALEASAVALQQESEQLRTRIAEIDRELKSERIDLETARERKAELAAQLAKIQSDLAHMGEMCLNELSLTADELRADSSLSQVEGERLAAEETLYREMRAKLDAMGPVNMMALEEYKETAQRHEFLDVQRKDLLQAIENTLSAIKEIDEVSRQKFQEAFERINENFQVTFRKLFAGGQAFMRLTDELNTAESGIDVVASPPGKKLQNVLLLSGGEKALTALSLLVGIFQYQPSPFCILDEVDAPLDDANVGRFTTLIKDMAAATQFILITHSKKTMSISPVMYGVTMQEPGVSKVVSVKFGQENLGTRSVTA